MNKFLRIGVSVALLEILAWRMDWVHVAEAFANLQWGYWLSAVAILAVTQVVSAWRWQLQARALGLSSSIAQMTGYYYIGMFFNLILPTSVGGDVVRAYYITGPSGRRLPGFVSVLVDRLNGLIVLLLLASVAAAVQFSKVPAWVCLFVWGTTLCAGVGILLLPWLAHWGKHGKLRVEQVRAMLQLSRQPRLLLQTTALSFVIQVANIVLVWQVGLALSLGANIGFEYYWILVPMVSVLTLLPVSVNGMGVREWGTLPAAPAAGRERDRRRHAVVSVVSGVRLCQPARRRWLICPDASRASRNLPRTVPNMDLSIIIPIKDERDNLTRLHESLSRALAPLAKSYEIIFVDDGSKDGSARLLEDLARTRRPASRWSACAAISANPRPCRPASISPPATSSSPSTAICKTTRPTFPCCSTSWPRVTTPCSANASNGRIICSFARCRA